MSADPRHRPPDTSTAADPRDGQRGFSLVELMIGAVVMVVGLFGVMTSCIRLHSLQRLDGELAIAYAACRENLEELRSVPISGLLALDGTGFDVYASTDRMPTLRPVPGDADALPGEIRVALDDASAGFELYRIEVAVTWRGNSGNHDVRLAMLRGGAP